VTFKDADSDQMVDTAYRFASCFPRRRPPWPGRTRPTRRPAQVYVLVDRDPEGRGAGPPKTSMRWQKRAAMWEPGFESRCGHQFEMVSVFRSGF